MLEKSAGAIIFHKSDRKIEYLLLRHKLGHWDFPKGHMEKGETLKATASREVEEETGFSNIIFVPNFKVHIKYIYTWEGEKRFKVATFFLTESKTKRVKISKEHLGHTWLSYKEAMKTLQFKNQKDLLKKGNEFLMK